MAGGNKNIHNHPNAGKGGFDKNPQNINRKGAPTLAERREKAIGDYVFVTFPPNQVIINPDGSVTVRMPSDKALEKRLKDIAFKGSDAISIKAMKEIRESKKDTPVNPEDMPTIIVVNDKKGTG